MFTSIKIILFALVAACLMLTTFASPDQIEKRAVTIPFNQQRCISHSHGLYVTYDVRVGRPFTSGHCDRLWGGLRAGGNPVTNWSCKRLGGGHMRIIFNVHRGQQNRLNNALSSTFPIIGRLQPFKCNGRNGNGASVG